MAVWYLAGHRTRFACLRTLVRVQWLPQQTTRSAFSTICVATLVTCIALLESRTAAYGATQPVGQHSLRRGSMYPVANSETDQLLLVAISERGFVHGQNVFDGGIRLDMVRTTQDEPTTVAQNVH